MNGIYSSNPVTGHQSGFWNLFRNIFQAPGIVSEPAKPKAIHVFEGDLKIFSHELELDDYVRSFRE